MVITLFEFENLLKIATHHKSNCQGDCDVSLYLYGRTLRKITELLSSKDRAIAIRLIEDNKKSFM